MKFIEIRGRDGLHLVNPTCIVEIRETNRIREGGGETDRYREVRLLDGFGGILTNESLDSLRETIQDGMKG